MTQVELLPSTITMDHDINLPSKDQHHHPLARMSSFTSAGLSSRISKLDTSKIVMQMPLSSPDGQLQANKHQQYHLLYQKPSRESLLLSPTYTMEELLSPQMKKPGLPSRTKSIRRQPSRKDFFSSDDKSNNNNNNTINFAKSLSHLDMLAIYDDKKNVATARTEDTGQTDHDSSSPRSAGSLTPTGNNRSNNNSNNNSYQQLPVPAIAQAATPNHRQHHLLLPETEGLSFSAAVATVQRISAHSQNSSDSDTSQLTSKNSKLTHSFKGMLKTVFGGTKSPSTSNNNNNDVNSYKSTKRESFSLSSPSSITALAASSLNYLSSPSQYLASSSSLPSSPSSITTGAKLQQLYEINASNGGTRLYDTGGEEVCENPMNCIPSLHTSRHSHPASLNHSRSGNSSIHSSTNNNHLRQATRRLSHSSSGRMQTTTGNATTTNTASLKSSIEKSSSVIPQLIITTNLIIHEGIENDEERERASSIMNLSTAVTTAAAAATVTQSPPPQRVPAIDIHPAPSSLSHTMSSHSLASDASTVASTVTNTSTATPSSSSNKQEQLSTLSEQTQQQQASTIHTAVSSPAVAAVASSTAAVVVVAPVTPRAIVTAPVTVATTARISKSVTPRSQPSLSSSIPVSSVVVPKGIVAAALANNTNNTSSSSKHVSKGFVASAVSIAKIKDEIPKGIVRHALASSSYTSSSSSLKQDSNTNNNSNSELPRRGIVAAALASSRAKGEVPSRFVSAAINATNIKQQIPQGTVNHYTSSSSSTVSPHSHGSSSANGSSASSYGSNKSGSDPVHASDVVPKGIVAAALLTSSSSSKYKNTTDTTAAIVSRVTSPSPKKLIITSTPTLSSPLTSTNTIATSSSSPLLEEIPKGAVAAALAASKEKPKVKSTAGAAGVSSKV